MTSIIPWFNDFDAFIDSMADKETTTWPLMQSASRALLVCLGYILVVTYVGPKLMENRKPYNLKKIIIVYNTFQVIVCSILFVWILRIKPTIGCEPLSHVRTDESLTIRRICWWTTLLKFAEFIETIFFVLRKKQNQVSALHVYHHTSTLVIVWGSTKLFPSKMVLTPIMINSLVHMLMYTYYLLSAIGPKVQRKIVKWKKYITIIQMVQFCVLMTYTAQIMSPYCNVPNTYAYIFIPNVFLVFYMFYQFYKQSYLMRRTPSKVN